MSAHADTAVYRPAPEAAATPPPPPLDPYTPTATKPWNARRAAHLYRRLGFGATHAQIQQALALSPAVLVDQLLDNAATLPPPAPPAWSNWTTADYAQYGFDKIEQHRREMRHRWMGDMLGEGIRARMAFFWHNHFVTKLLVYGCNAYMWAYYDLLHRMAFGNFRDFALEMGKNPAMLVFLNGNLNIADEPNENYARELMELFTMGESNGYTQQDVVEMSRALTGWTASFNDCTPAAFDSTRFDNTSKTIFGVTNNFDFTTAHQLVFSERPVQVSKFIVGKIYKHFVHRVPNAAIVDGLAETFRNNNWELLPVLKQLFKSEHFFEEPLLNAKLKSPVDTFIPLFKMAGAEYPLHVLPVWWEDTTYWLHNLGQDLFGPINVAGWPEHRAWVNESTLTARWNYASLAAQLLATNANLREKLRMLAKSLTNNSNNPVVVTTALIEFFIGQTLEPLYLDAAVEYFKDGVPSGYFTNGTWDLDYPEAPYQVVQLIQYLVKMPEFQLT